MVLTENNICFLTFPFFLASSFAVLNLAVQFCCVSLTSWGHQWLFQGPVPVFLSLSCSMGTVSCTLCLAPACFSRKLKQLSVGSVLMLMGAAEQMLLFFQDLIFFKFVSVTRKSGQTAKRLLWGDAKWNRRRTYGRERKEYFVQFTSGKKKWLIKTVN